MDYSKHKLLCFLKIFFDVLSYTEGCEVYFEVRVIVYKYSQSHTLFLSLWAGSN